ncbi:hypothetical protein ABXV18_27055 [Vibrio owensii]|uniref:hypothetical protein n=1 Tax=Vibrio owensii TaxID=696485 RepID=UPI0033941F8A
MKLKDLLIETTSAAHFYFDPAEKVFTKERLELNVQLCIKGEHYTKELEYFVFSKLELMALRGDFDKVETLDDMGEIEI